MLFSRLTNKTKTTKKSSVRVGGASKNSKLKKSNPNKKKYIFLSALFAVVGGYFVYQSFAASRTWSYSLELGNLSATTTGTKCRSNKSYDTTFKVNVWGMYCPKGVSPVSTATTMTVGSYLPKGSSGKYRFCTYIKGVAGMVTFTTAPYIGVGTQRDYEPDYSRLNDYTVKDGSTYKYHCSNYVTVNAKYNTVNMEGSVRISSQHGGGLVNVGGMVLERQ